jgi:deoxyribose-phosphate aldolase
MGLSLERRFTDLIERLDTHVLPASRVFPLMDLTRLDDNAAMQDINQLIAKAQQDSVAAICVFPQHLAWVPMFDAIQRATVVNFPGGNVPHDQVLQDIEQAITQQQADEIDYVFAYSHYLAGQRSHALGWCEEAYQLCRQHGRLFKVILETGALPSVDSIYQVSGAVIEAGCDMLKTSTGKIAIGATLPAAFAMLTAIQDSHSDCGIKISGGVKTLAQASSYLHLAEHIRSAIADKTWFRIGASQII